MSILRRIFFYLLCALGFCASSMYVWSYLSQSQNSLRTVVFGLFLIIIMLAMISWKTAVLTFVFCLPLFNTLPTILGVEKLWPPFNFNLLFLSGLTTAFLIYVVTGQSPESRRHHNKGIPATPYDGLWFIFTLLVVLGMIIGACRYENVFSLGFYRELPGKLLGIPFASQTENVLCYTKAMQFISMMLAFYFVSTVLKDQKDVYTVLRLLIGAAVIVCIYGVWQNKTKLFLVGIQEFFGRINATFNGPDSAATYYLVMGILAFSGFWFAKKIVHYLTLIFLFALSFVCLYLTETRTAVYAFGLALFVVFVMVVSRSRKLLKPLPYVLALAGLLLFFAPANEMTLPGSYTLKALKSQRLVQGLDKMKIEPRKIDELLSFRSYHWFAALQAIKDAPVFGHGLGTFDKLYKDYKTSRDGYKSAFAHNLYLDYWVEMGLPGLFVSIFFFVFSIFLSWRLWSNECCGKHARSLALGLLTAQLSVALGNLFSSSLYYVTELMFLQSVFLAMLSTLFKSVYPSGPETLREEAAVCCEKLKTGRLFRFAAAAVVVLIFGIFLILCRRSALQGEAQYYSCEPYDNLGRMLEYGILHYEYDQHSNKFARTRRHVYRPLLVNSRYLSVYLRASHPDADLKPVPASFSVNGKLAGSCVISNRTWNAFVIDVGRIVPILTNEEMAVSGEKIPINLEMISGRMWNPLDWNPQEQNIKYGVDLGTILQGLF